MPNHQSTLILFLLDRHAVPKLNAEQYLCGLVETPQPQDPFSLANVTDQDNKANRKTIIKLIRGMARDLEEGRIISPHEIREIGEQVWWHLGLEEFFCYLKEQHREVTFLTNDPSMPWDWATEHSTGSSISEQQSCGSVFFEQMDLAGRAARQARRRNPFDSHGEQLAKTKAILLFDEGRHHRLSSLPRVEEEVNAVRDELLKAGLEPENVQLINGYDDDAEADFLKHMRYMREDLGIIHYAGHIVDGDLRLRRCVIQRQEIKNFFRRDKLLRSLVFINGCDSGAVPLVWEKGKNLATAWLDAGADAMIGCRLPVEDSRATLFATAFYKKLLSREQAHDTVGKVLMDTKKELISDHPDGAWLQYTLYGYPYNYFLDQLPSVSLAEATAPDELRKLMQSA